MTVEAPPSARAPRRELIVREEYELDLRALVAVVLRHLPFVLACLALAVAAAAVYVYLQPRVYLGVSKVLISRPKTQVALEPRFASREDFELRPFFTQAKHPAVEQAVRGQLSGLLTEHERSPGELTKRIQVRSARDDAGLMELHFVDRDAVKASAVANTWADVYIKHAQESLNPAVHAQRVVDAQLRDLQAQLQQREDALRDFQQRTGLGLTLLEDSVRLGVPGAAVSPGSRLGIRGRELTTRASTLSEFRQQQDQLRLTLTQARALRAAGASLEALGADLEKAGVARGTGADAAIASLESRDRALAETIDRLAADLRQQAAIAAGDLSMLERLERDRDVARDAYLTVAKKAEENKIALASDWPVVQLFAAAPDPAGVEPRPWLTALGPAAAAGLVVGVGGAFLLDRRRGARAGRAARRETIDSIA